MALGASRKKQEGLTNTANAVRIGEQVDRNTQSDKLAQSGTLSFGGGRSTLRRDEIVTDHRQTFRDSAKGLEKDDPRRSTKDILREQEVKAGPPVATERKGGPVRGTMRAKAVAQGDVEMGKFDAMKPGSSIGNFSIGRRTAADDNARLGGGGTFTKAGVKGIFQSSAKLAKLFATPEYQESINKGPRQRRASKEVRANQKAVNERVKALGTLKTQLTESGEAPDSSIMQTIDKQLQEQFTGGADRGNVEKVGLLGQLLEIGDLTPEQERIIIGE